MNGNSASATEASGEGDNSEWKRAIVRIDL